MTIASDVLGELVVDDAHELGLTDGWDIFRAWAVAVESYERGASLSAAREEARGIIRESRYGRPGWDTTDVRTDLL